MEAFMNLKDIRFKYDEGLKMLRRGIITKRDLANNTTGYIEVENTSYPIAEKYINFISIEVKCNDWINIHYGDYKMLKKAFAGEFDSVEEKKEEVVVEETPAIEEIKEEDTTATDFVSTDKTWEEITSSTEEAVEEKQEEAPVAEEASEEIAEEVKPEENTNNHQQQNQQYSFKKKKKH